MAHHYTKELVLEAIEGCAGIVQTVANRLECTWDTAERWINKWEDTRTAMKNENEKVLDMAEGQVLKAVKGGDLQTAKWLLSRKGKARGWGEDNSLKLANDDPLKVDISGEPMSAEDLAGSADIEVTGGDKE